MRQSIILRLIIYVVASLLLISAVFYLFINSELGRLNTDLANETKTFAYGLKQSALKDMVAVPMSRIDELAALAKTTGSTEQAKAEAMAEIRSMRLADGNYFWINDLEPRMVMHPISTELEGTDLSQYKDKAGKKLFVEMVEVAKDTGEGFVDYTWTKPGEDGQFPKLSYVKLYEPWGWIVGMGVYVDDLDAVIGAQEEMFVDNVSKVLRNSLLVVGIVSLLVIITIVFYIRLRLSKPFVALVNYSQSVAQGDLDAIITGNYHGELLQMKSSTETMVASLKERMLEAQQNSEHAASEAEKARQAMVEAQQAKEHAEQAKSQGMLEAAAALEAIASSLGAASEELSAQAGDINMGTSQQKQRIDETATAMEEMNATILEVARNASTAAENAQGAQDKAREGADVVRRSVAAIQSVQMAADELKTSMDQLTEQATAIGQIMSVITDIADQTNLLALNAAIEAARAGDAGRGFAVVADEVRKLAEKTMNATKDVAHSIEAIQGAAEQNRAHVQRAVDAVTEATALSRQSGESLEEIVSLSETSADQVRSIATASEEQSAASEQLTRTIEEINQLSSHIADSIEQTAAAQGDLAEQASKLNTLIQHIKTENS